MGIADTANAVFRDYVTDGVAGSGANKPSKAEIRALMQAIQDAIVAGAGSVPVGGGISVSAGQETAFQNFSQVADGTLLSGFTLDTGQSLNMQGPAGSTASVVNSDGQSGYVIASDTFYAVIDFPHKNFVAEMIVSFDGVDPTSGIAMGCGRFVGGAIISKMVHAQWDYQLGGLTLWGSDHNSSGQPNLLYSDLPLFNEYDNVAKVSNYDTPIRVSVIVIDNVCMMSWNDGQIVQQWSYAGAGSGVNNGSISSLVGEYIYFETTTANHMKVHSIYARSLTLEDQLSLMAHVLPPPGIRGVPTLFTGSVPFATATEIFRFTPPNTLSGVALRIALSVWTESPVAGYCQTFSEWSVVGTQSGGVSYARADQNTTERVQTVNGATLSLSAALTVVISGVDVLVKLTVTRTGADASTYAPGYDVQIDMLGRSLPLSL